MPRERRAPGTAAQPKSILSPVKMPLNDDRGEKAVRFQSRQALHDMQMNQIRAAASPMKRKSLLGVTGSPRTPNGDDKENDDSQGLNVVGNAVTPMKRVPILANFEEWMKMATDNVRLKKNLCCPISHIDLYRKSMLQIPGTLRLSTTSTTCLY